MEPKTCEGCGQMFYPGPESKPGIWAHKRYCTPRCGEKTWKAKKRKGEATFVDFFKAPLADKPTTARPGSTRKKEVLRKRAKAKVALFHPDDAPPEKEWDWSAEQASEVQAKDDACDRFMRLGLFGPGPGRAASPWREGYQGVVEFAESERD